MAVVGRTEPTEPSTSASRMDSMTDMLRGIFGVGGRSNRGGRAGRGGRGRGKARYNPSQVDRRLSGIEGQKHEYDQIDLELSISNQTTSTIYHDVASSTSTTIGRQLMVSNGASTSSGLSTVLPSTPTSSGLLTVPYHNDGRNIFSLFIGSVKTAQTASRELRTALFKQVNMFGSEWKYVCTSISV